MISLNEVRKEKLSKLYQVNMTNYKSFNKEVYFEQRYRNADIIAFFLETIDELEKKRKSEPPEEKEDIEDDDGEKGSVKGSELSVDDVYEEDEEPPSKFSEVYSDSDTEDEDVDDEG